MKVNEALSEPTDKRHTAGLSWVRRRWKLGFAALLLTSLAATRIFLLAADKSDDPDASAEPVMASRVLPVVTVPVEMEDAYTVEEHFVGRVEAARVSDLGFELPGTLASMALEEGEQVEAGQTLGCLDTARLEAKRDEAEAGLSQVESALELAASTFKRTESAAASRAVSRQQADEASERLNHAKAAVRRLRSQLEAIDVDLEKSVLKAPYAGTISVRHADEGTIVAAGQPVYRLLETGRLEIRAGLSARAAAEVRPGDVFSIEAQHGQGTGELVSAKVLRLLPQRNQRTRTVDAILGVDQDVTNCLEGMAPLRDGDLVEVPVAREISEPGVWLPRSAMTESARGLWAAYALVPLAEAESETGDVWQLERRQLELVDESADRVYVRGALHSGEQIVAAGLHRLAPGQRVRPSVTYVEGLTQN